MFNHNNKISIRQLQILIILDIFGVGVISLPKIATQYGNTDAPIVVCLAIIIALIYSLLISFVIEKYPNKNFVEIVSTITIEPVAYVVCSLFFLKLIIGVAMQIRLFAEIVNVILLPKTPIFIVVLTMIMLSAYSASKGYESRARLSEILIYFSIIPITIVFIIVAADVDFTNLLPILKTPREDILKGALFCSFAFNGLDLCLLVSPYINKPQKVRRGLLQVVLIIGFMFLIFTIITVARFGQTETKRFFWPILAMMDTIDLPGSFMERQEWLLIAFWTVSVFSVATAYLFFCTMLIKDITKKGTHKLYIKIIVPVIFFICMFPENADITSKYLAYSNENLALMFLFFVPLILILMYKLRFGRLQKQ